MLLPYYQDVFVEAGCDEAGRGCLAGPVFAAAVILPRDFSHNILTDSKQLKAEERDELRVFIENNALAWAVAEVDHEEIDRINILNASFLAMHKALDSLSIRPEHVLVDGNRFKKYCELPHTCVVKGDGKYFSIAAASILAKTYRDEFMQRIAGLHPEYEWHSNKGYPTIKHRNAVLKHGFSPYHRKTFRVTDPQLDLFQPSNADVELV
ncbi:RNase HII [Arcticibacter pallidicorallinus]|uniref:Ribonuclease HII n=1 Tax=Arcticibacter pallidicorallinus TaxID=1259464 RepID=A0A2T0U6X5_9SPHI|nr:ribonuclease HII [Arcticibacter pallidicorallinus]PRY53618.1 RNase HII [Arcticibacter pallidicorallinus]